MDDDLVEVGHHVVDSSQVHHRHVNSDRLCHIADLDVHVVRSAQVRSFLLLVALADHVQDFFLSPQMLVGRLFVGGSSSRALVV